MMTNATWADLMRTFDNCTIHKLSIHSRTYTDYIYIYVYKYKYVYIARIYF